MFLRTGSQKYRRCRSWCERLRWQPAKDAARQIAFAEDAAIFEGYAAAGIGGIRQGSSNPIKTLPADVREYPDAIAQGLSRLRLVGVNGPYAVFLGADAYTALAETSDHGYPVLEHVSGWSKTRSSGPLPSPGPSY